ncbi:MPN domain-containing protein CG4751 [Galleria mellonella]|uniref:MPN domain-containing protein CG4751 n=1 Tax=Galleria mellonella TaxID=7137 RepID=A0ABM3M9B7_GALME|nr:MPN domain-containing protein CG4751 [Galleria mellonella]
MDLQTSHLAAALMSGSIYNNTPAETTPNIENIANKPEKSNETLKEHPDEEKEEMGSEEGFSDEENEAQTGNKSIPGRGVTLQMLLEEKMLEPGTAAMTIEYLGQKFVGDLQSDGKIKSHETETIFCSPSAWAIHCKRIINPDKRSGCGWASVKYRGKKLDTIKATYLRKKQLQRENMHTDEETEMEVENPPEPPPQRVVMKHNTVPNRMMQHDTNMLIEAVSFSSVGKAQPFIVSVSSNACLVLDIHCHLKKEEVYGYLAGTWDLNTHNLMITHTFPCLVSKNDSRPRVLVELEIQMEIEKLGLTLLGWYHSHPTNPAMPSLRDCDNQLEYQIKMRGPSEISYIPCIGVICSPYNPESPVLESSLTFFWVMPPSEQRPTEYPRPLLLQYNMIHDSHLSPHAMEQIKKSIKYYFTFTDDTFINFKDNFKPDITFLDKLKCTLTAKFPREQSDGLLWHFIRDELGCSSEHDDKMDLDALLAVPQPIPVSKPSQTTSVPNFPSVSTLQQMVSRPAGVPPINVSSGIGSPHKFETPPLNIPVLSTSTKSSKSSSSSLSSTYPTGLDMLTSMALGLGSSNLPLPLGTTGLESLAAANSMLTGLTPNLPSSLAASLSSNKLPDPPSYAASLQNLTSSIGNYDKTPSSTATSTTSTPIPASIASNLMMSSADIANALFSASKYSSAGILGIPDPMSKSTLAANNMFLSPSLMKMQETLLKPLSSSSSISSKVGLDQNVLMKSPHDLLKGNKDYLPPDFGSVGKGKTDNASVDAVKLSEGSGSSKGESSKSENVDMQATDFSMSSRVGGDSFLNQMLELTKKTTMPDYMSDYGQPPLKMAKSEELPAPVPPSSHSYLNTSSIVDTIAQVAMGNFSKHDESMDYIKEQDYTTNKTTMNENDN